MPRPFRFGVQAFEATSSNEWFDVVDRAEGLGYSTLFTSDHYFGPGAISDSTGHRPVELGPLTAIAFAAARTTSLRVGCRVFSCDFHHPVVLAKETATLDLLSGGRLEVGLGAGWIAAEYEGLGMRMDSAATRIARLGEYVAAIRAHWSGEQIDVAGDHVNVRGFAGRPIPHQTSHGRVGPPIMIGGGAPKVLALAGRLADIVSFNYNNASGKLDGASVASSGRDATIQKLNWVREAAGDRYDDIELEIGAYFLAVGNDVESRRSAIAERFRVDPSEFATHPHALFGSVGQICDELIARREQYGISYITIAQRCMDEFAPVVAALSGT